MLLRSISKHVKSQNWFAVFLDFFIVVVGILLALQVTNWSEGYTEQQRSKDYLKRISDNLEIDIQGLQRRKLYWQDVSDSGYQIINYAETGDMKNATSWELLRSVIHASQSWPFSFDDTTYSELRSTGDWRLIASPELRTMLADYYVKVADRRKGDGHYQLLPKYREMVRSKMRIDIMDYYWTACYEQGMGTQQLLECPAPEEISDFNEILKPLIANEELIEALRYWIDTQRMAVELTDLDMARANNILSAVSEISM